MNDDTTNTAAEYEPEAQNDSNDMNITGVDTDDSLQEDENNDQDTRSYQVPGDQFGSGIRMNLRKQP